LGVADDGGSDITSYSLEIDDGAGGDFTAVCGLNQSYLVLHRTVTNVTKGVTYRLKYRAQNAIGWSPYSPTTYVRAATVPIAPPRPIYLSSSATFV